MNLAGKHIVITGATGGIGRAIASSLAEQGAALLLVGRNTEQLAVLKNSLPGEGHTLVGLDLLKPGAAEALYQAANAFSVDGVINAAGAGQLCFLQDVGPRDIEHMVALNLTVPMHVCRTLVPLLTQKPGSFLVNVGSILGSIGLAGSTVYCATKFGLRGFTEALQRELADTSVRVIYFAPRATNTSLNSTAVQAMNDELNNAVDEPAWVANELVKALTRKKSSRFFLGWPEKFFVRLNALLPGIVDGALRKQLDIIRRYATKTTHENI